MTDNFKADDIVLDISQGTLVTLLEGLDSDGDYYVKYPGGTEAFVTAGALVAQGSYVFKINDRVTDESGEVFTVVGRPGADGCYRVAKANGDVVYRPHMELSLVEAPEAVVHPSHYNEHPSGVECIELIRDMPFSLGSAVKYTWRTGLKNVATAEEDLKKARFMLRDFLMNSRGGVTVDMDTLIRVIRDTPVDTPLWYVLLGVMFTEHNLPESARSVFSNFLDSEESA